MGKTSKIAIGVSIASGLFLAAWLLTGTRKEKTKKLISKGKATLTKTLGREKKSGVIEDSDIHYV